MLCAASGKELVKTTAAMGAATNRERLIIFDENGQLVLRKNLNVPSLTASSITSAPGFLVFNLADLQAATDNGLIPAAPAAARDAGIGNWVEQNTEVVIFNAYTGNAIR